MTVKNSEGETILILGGDGYLGWSLGLAFANRTDKNVVLADNMIKRKWEKEVQAKVLVPQKSPKARIAEYTKVYGKTNLSFTKLDLLDQNAVARTLRKYKPAVIINAAQQPSAPFSMMNAKNAAATFTNNLVGHMNLLWSVAQVDKGIKVIKLGSAGCYMDVDTSYLPLGKKDFTFVHGGKQHKILNSLMPMQATDFYHQSKISDFLVDDLCAKVWGLKILTVQQATIFGATIDENYAPEHVGLSARFNYDAVFSTVLNRFACQAAIGHPLTVYGSGKQRTGLISLADCVKNFIEFAELPLAVGKHKVVHNLTHRLTIEEIAAKIAEADPTVKVIYMKNPRNEPVGKLSRDIQLHGVVKARHANKDLELQRELARMNEFARRHVQNIDAAIILPIVEWSANPTAKRSLKQQWAIQLRQWEHKYISSLPTKDEPEYAPAAVKA